jgi:choline-sulfatase
VQSAGDPFRLGARPNHGERAPSRRATRAVIIERWLFFAGDDGLLGACSCFSDTLLAALFVALPLALCACRDRAPARVTPAQRPNMLLVTIDTWRADRLGVGISPALDQLAASGIRFTAARTAVPLTLPSHTTILTGLLPPAHGVRVNGLDTLSSAHPTIAHLLKSAGYRTAAFIGAFVLDRRFGLAAGFDTYDDQIPRDPRASERLEAERPAAVVVDRALAWLDTSIGSIADTSTRPAPPAPPALPALPVGPFFMWIHLYDPHAPYTPPPEFLERVTRLRITNRKSNTAYDGEVAYADSQLARVFFWLQARGLAERTVIVAAGDHGEGLGEHGEQTHGMLLYDSTLRVPLVVAASGHQAVVRDEAVSLTDVAPTILAAAGVTQPDEMKGRNLLGEARLKPDATEEVRLKPDTTDRGASNRPVFADNSGRDRLQPAANSGSVRLQPDLYSETEYPRATGWSPLQALTDGRWTTIRAGSVMEVYDLQNDPQELHNVWAAQPSVAGAMSARIDAIRATDSHLDKAVAPGLTREAEDRLRALGYVASSSQREVAAHAPNPATLIDVWNRFEEALSALQARRRNALTLLEPLAREHPESLVFQTTTARAMKEAGNVDKALAMYRSAARRWPTDPMLFHDLAVAARDVSQSAQGASARALHDEAEKAERVAVALSPNNATAHNGLGLLAVDEGRTQDAAAEFERASAMDPNNASYLANLGNARRALGDRAAAEQAYRQALDISPATADAANGLGVLLVEAQRPADAVTWFERALASAPDLAEARLNLGIAFQESGQPARAAEQYRRVLAAAGPTREKNAAAKLLGALRAGR